MPTISKSGSDNSGSTTPTLQVQVLSEPSAMYLFEKKGDPHASLRAYQHIWENSTAPSSSSSSSSSASASSLNDNQKHSSQQSQLFIDHNRSILLHLTSNAASSEGVKQESKEQTSSTNSLLEQLVQIHQDQVQHMLQLGKEDFDDYDIDDKDNPTSFTFNIMFNSCPENSMADELSTKLVHNHSKLIHDKTFNGQSKMMLPFKIVTHNIALIYLSSGKPLSSLFLLINLFHKFIYNSDADTTTSKSDVDYEDYVDCRITFLILDSVLAQYKGDPLGLPKSLLMIIQESIPIEYMDKGLSSDDSFTLNNLYQWIEAHVERYSLHNHSSNNNNQNTGPKEDEYTNEIKFRLHLYKARSLFLSQSAIKQDIKMRQCKKEMKSAMEIFQHKLRFGSNIGSGSNEDTGVETETGTNTTGPRLGPEGEAVINAVGSTGSIGSASDVPIVSEDLNPPSSTQSHSQQSRNTQQHNHHQWSENQYYTHGALKLDMQNECALYLKANLEHQKSNPKKSLVLCNEARLAGDRYREQVLASKSNQDGNDNSKHDTQDISKQEDLDSAIHFSNLGSVFQSTGRLHMAFLYYIKALKLVEKLSNSLPVNESAPKNFCFTADGMVRSIPACEILHNTAICALQLKNWEMAYECMGKCVKYSPNVFAKRARCWLRMAESCIGIHEYHKKNQRHEFDIKIMGGENGFPTRLIVDSKNRQPMPTETIENLEEDIGSLRDLDQVRANPLLRAVACLRIALSIVYNCSEPDLDCLEAARLSFAYVMLELNEPIESLEMAKLVYSDDNDTKEGEYKQHINQNIISTTLSDQRKATARLYACEAFCKIGNPKKAYEAIFGPYDEDEIERDLDNETPDSMNLLKKLAHDLAGTGADTPVEKLNLEEQKSDPFSKEFSGDKINHHALNHAISCLRVSMSGLHASLDNVEAAERNAEHALRILESIDQKTMDITGTVRSVKKALLYCYLFKGDTDNAIQLLHSLI